MAHAHKITGCMAVLLALMTWCSDGYGQQAEPEAKLTLDQLMGAAKRYFRDTAEFPMQQKTTFSVSDAKGRIRETKLQVTEYLFQGYKPKEQKATGNVHGSVSLWQYLRGARMVKISAGNAFWTMLPGMILSADPSGFIFAAKSTDPAADLLSAQLIPNRPCPVLTMTQKTLFYMPDELCGTSAFELHNDLKFQKFAFEIAGLPAPVKIDPFGQCTLQHYRVEIEFQSVTLPGDKEPFLIPRQSSAHLETNKGVILITSVFEPKK